MSNFLDEKQFQKNKKRILNIGRLVFIIGFLISFTLIITGISNNVIIDKKYSEENKGILKNELIEIENDLKTEKELLEAKIKPIENEIKALERVPFVGFNNDYYERIDKIEELKKGISQDKKTLSYIEKILVHSDFSCNLTEDSGNKRVDEYCEKKEILNDIESDFNKSHEKSGNIVYFILGSFLLFATFIISGGISMFGRRREFLAFNIQQTMPVIQEGMETMAPTVGNVTSTIIEKVTPSISKASNTILKENSEGMGQLAKEITKGIKEGIESSVEKK